MKNYRRTLLSLAIVTALAGCSNNATKEDPTPPPPPVVEEQPVVENNTQTPADTGDSATTSGVEMGGRFAGKSINELLSDKNSLLSRQVFYFDFDSSTVSEADREALMEHAALLTERTELSIAVEGHADERGTREYNLALGERRAQAVANILSLQGVAASQMQVISFGEERPVMMGHDETSWYQNRRVELIYSGY